jgi:hypothetical protein
MSILYTIDKEKGVTYVMWDGIVPAEEWFKHIRKLLADPEWILAPNLIVDFRSVTDTSSIGNEDVDHVIFILEEARPSVAGKKIAAIARDEFDRALRFAYSAPRLGISMVVFHNPDVACTFLGIDLNETLQVFDRLRAQMRA